MVEKRTTSDAYVMPGTSNAWSAEAAQQGRTGSQRLIEVATIAAPRDVGAALALPPEAQVVVRRRLMLLDDEPMEIASSFYPADIAAGTTLAALGKIRGGAVAALAALGHQAVEVVEQVTARSPRAEEVELLQVAEAEPLLVLARVSLDAAGRSVEYAVNCMVAARSPALVYRMRTSSA